MPPDLLSLSFPLFTQCACVCVCVAARQTPKNSVQRRKTTCKIYGESFECFAVAKLAPQRLLAQLQSGHR